MPTRPVLILQMQRMGDMVLTFPLLEWLRKLFPERPLWVVGEEVFSRPLLFLSPQAEYFSYEQVSYFTSIKFHLVINLSHRLEAARIAGTVKSDALIGPYFSGDNLLVAGHWQLYRMSLTHNNHYNRYHWAELNALDCIPAECFRLGRLGHNAHNLSQLRPGEDKNLGKRVGLFLGASDSLKHPDVLFWVQLTKLLLDRGYKPVLLGGQQEKTLGKEVARQLDVDALDFCGRFDMHSFALFLSELDLFVVPDTGPMHVAVWSRTPTLNLAVGNVSSWETGPFSPGHYVLRAGLPCSGCWSCSQDQPLCKKIMDPLAVFHVIHSLLNCQCLEEKNLAWHLGGLELLRSGQDELGLYNLDLVSCGSKLASFTSQYYPPSDQEKVIHSPMASEYLARPYLSNFWKYWFGAYGRFCSESYVETATRHLWEHVPSAAQMLVDCANGLLQWAITLPKDYNSFAHSFAASWQQWPACLCPLTGFLQLYLLNGHDAKKRLHTLLAIESVRAVLRK